MTQDSSQYKPEIDGLRAIAVLSVILFHVFPKVLHGGFVGVDIFFVISGYLISGIIFKELEQNSFSYLKFYARRVRRIFPALIIILCVSMIYAWFMQFPVPFKLLGKHVAGGTVFISNILFWQESGYFDANAIDKPLLHLWSLGVEEQFYIIWPICVVLFIRHKRSLLALILSIIAVSFVANIYCAKTDPSADFYLPMSRFWELLLGAFLAYSQAFQSFKLRHSNSASWSGIALILVSVFALNDKLIYPGFWAILPVLGAVLLIMAGSASWFNTHILAHPILVKIGIISYPLYLWHWPLISFAHQFKQDRLSTFWRIVIIVLSFILAWLTYYCVERPIRQLKPLSKTVLTLCFICAITGGIGLIIYKNNGFDTRFEARLRPLANFDGVEMGEYLKDDKCFIYPSSKLNLIDECASTQLSATMPTLIIWGDSYTAHLYAGLYARFSNQWNVKQLSSGGCPPIFNFSSRFQPDCPAFNQRVLDVLAKNPPKKLVLAARWQVYNWQKLSETIDALHKIGVQDIDLVGPVPEWTENLNKLLYRYLKNNPQINDIPQRISFGLKPEVEALDEQMKQFASVHNMHYFAPRAVFCNQNGCLTRVGDKNNALTTFDAGHLTREGSIYLGAHFP